MSESCTWTFYRYNNKMKNQTCIYQWNASQPLNWSWVKKRPHAETGLPGNITEAGKGQWWAHVTHFYPKWLLLRTIKTVFGRRNNTTICSFSTLPQTHVDGSVTASVTAGYNGVKCLLSGAQHQWKWLWLARGEQHADRDSAEDGEQPDGEGVTGLIHLDA